MLLHMHVTAASVSRQPASALSNYIKTIIIIILYFTGTASHQNKESRRNLKDVSMFDLIIKSENAVFWLNLEKELKEDYSDETGKRNSAFLFVWKPYTDSFKECTCESIFHNYFCKQCHSVVK